MYYDPENQSYVIAQQPTDLKTTVAGMDENVSKEKWWKNVLTLG